MNVWHQKGDKKATAGDYIRRLHGSAGAVHSSPFLFFFLSTTYHHLPLPSRVMFVMLIAFLIAAFALLCIRFPSVWSALMASDEPSDPHELGLVVASRAPWFSLLQRRCLSFILIVRKPFP